MMRTCTRVLLALATFLAGCADAPMQGATREVAPRPASAPISQLRKLAPDYHADDGPDGAPPVDLARVADAIPRPEPLHPTANDPYTVFGRDYVPLKAPGNYKLWGTASWYGRKYHGQRSASGEVYDMYALSASHRTLPIPSYARITNLANRASVVVRINGRGPFAPRRIADLSYAAAYRLGFAQSAVALVEVESILAPDQAVAAAAEPPAPRTAGAPALAPAPPAAQAAQAAAKKVPAKSKPAKPAPAAVAPPASTREPMKNAKSAPPAAAPPTPVRAARAASGRAAPDPDARKCLEHSEAAAIARCAEAYR